MTTADLTISEVEQTFRAERGRLFRFIRRRVRNEADVEDILQDVFHQMVASYSVTEPIEELTRWLFTVARNRVIDWYRKRRSIPLPGEDDDASAPLNLEEILFDPAENPDEVYHRSFFWRELADALDDLPEPQREVFVMHELEGKSFKEMAEITGVSVNTLLSRKRYAVLALRESLQEIYDDFRS